MKYSVFFLSDTGRVRQLNEDSMRVERPADPNVAKTRGDLYVVADGMGGHESGEVASGIAIETIAKAYYSSAKNLPADEALAQAIEQANAEIYRRAQQEDRHGMGTTVVSAARIDRYLHIAHVGDSRMYLIRDGHIRPLTQDHSMVAEQVAAGIITPEEAERHPYRNVISRAVGTAPEVDVEISQSSPLELREGDVVLLCSDGLTEHVKPPKILELVNSRAPEPAAHALIQAANSGGGSDNITVILLRVGDVKSGNNPVTAVMPVSDAITEPHPVVDAPAAAPQGVAAAAPARSGGGGGFGKIIGALLLVGLVAFGSWYAFSSGWLSSITASSPTPVAATATAPEATATIAPTRTVRPTRVITPAANATTVPMPTVPPTPLLPTLAVPEE